MRRKILSLSLILVMLIAAMPTHLHAEDTDFAQEKTEDVSHLDNNYEYDINVLLQGQKKIFVVLGQGKDNNGHDYSFDFINDPKRLSLDHTVVKKIEENVYEFVSGNKRVAVLTYYPDGYGENTRCFELVAVNPLTDVELNYSVKLDNPTKIAGEYTGLIACQIQSEKETKDIAVKYSVPYSYTVEHHYYTYSLDNNEPVEDGVIVEKDPVVTHTSEINVDDLMITSLYENQFENDNNSEEEPEVPEQGEDKTDTENPSGGNPGNGNHKPGNGHGKPGWSKQILSWVPSIVEVHALEKEEQKLNFGKGYAFRVVNGKLIPITDGKVELDKDPAKNKIVIKYYRTSYTVEHKYYTSTNNSDYQLDGVVLSKEYMGFEGETVYTHNILTKVRYNDELYHFYKYNDDSLVLQLNPHLNKIIVEYRREVTVPNDDVMDNKKPPQTKPLPEYKEKAVNTGDNSNIVLYAGLGLAALAAMVILLKKKK